MATNPLFNNYNSATQQDTLEKLIIESIKIYGQDMYYIPRVLNNYDSLYGSDDNSSYETPYSVEMYIKSVNGFSGDGDFMSKFGIEIHDQVIFSVARKSFDNEVGNAELADLPRPMEGDLIYFPLNNKCFQIKYVNKFEMFYPLGKLYTWEMTCELFEYSGENMDTGIESIDSLQDKFGTNLYSSALNDESLGPILDENGNLILLEADADNFKYYEENDIIQEQSDLFVDFSSIDPFSEGTL